MIRPLLVQNVFPESSSVIHLLQDPPSGKLEKVKLAAIVTFGKLLKLNIPNFSGVYGYFYSCAFDVWSFVCIWHVIKNGIV